MELRFKLTLKSGRTMAGTVVTDESPREWLVRNMAIDVITFSGGNKAYAVSVSEIESAEVEAPLKGDAV